MLVVGGGVVVPPGRGGGVVGAAGRHQLEKLLVLLVGDQLGCQGPAERREVSGAAGGEVVSPAGQSFIGGDGGDRDAREVGDDAGESSGLVRVELVAEQDNVGAPGVGQIRVEPLLSNGDVVGEVAPASSSAVFETCQNPVDVVDLGDRWDGRAPR